MTVYDICDFCVKDQGVVLCDYETGNQLTYGNAKEFMHGRYSQCGVEEIEGRGGWLYLDIDTENERL